METIKKLKIVAVFTLALSLSYSYAGWPSDIWSWVKTNPITTTVKDAGNALFNWNNYEQEKNGAKKLTEAEKLEEEKFNKLFVDEKKLTPTEMLKSIDDIFSDAEFSSFDIMIMRKYINTLDRYIKELKANNNYGVIKKILNNELSKTKVKTFLRFLYIYIATGLRMTVLNWPIHIQFDKKATINLIKKALKIHDAYNIHIQYQNLGDFKLFIDKKHSSSNFDFLQKAITLLDSEIKQVNDQELNKRLVDEYKTTILNLQKKLTAYTKQDVTEKRVMKLNKIIENIISQYMNVEKIEQSTEIIEDVIVVPKKENYDDNKELLERLVKIKMKTYEKTDQDLYKEKEKEEFYKKCTKEETERRAKSLKMIHEKQGNDNKKEAPKED